MKQKIIFRCCIIIMLSAFPVLPVQADTAAGNVDKICLQHAISLVNRLKTDVMTDMDASQSDKALKIITDNCKTYFSKSGGNKEIADIGQNDVEKDQKEEEDWFTKFVLEGDAPDKKGNRRLKRMQHK